MGVKMNTNKLDKVLTKMGFKKVVNIKSIVYELICAEALIRVAYLSNGLYSIGIAKGKQTIYCSTKTIY
jgi:hypothetical protein